MKKNYLITATVFSMNSGGTLVLNYLCQFKIVVSKSSFKLNPLSILLISYIFTYMFRWTGLTAGPLLGLLFLLLGLQSKKKISLLE